MKKIYFTITIILVGVTLFIFTREGKPLSEKPAQTPQSSAAPISVLETQTNNDGPVTVKVTPKFSSEITFEITLDTHSGELDDDLTQAAAFKDENGKEYKPIRWEGNLPGGHHRSGILTFGPISPVPRTIKLIIQNIGGIARREFLWTTRP